MLRWKIFFTGLIIAGSLTGFAQSDSVPPTDSPAIRPLPVQVAPVKKTDTISTTHRSKPDSAFKKDSTRRIAKLLRDSLVKDSTRKASLAAVIVRVDTSTYRKYETNPYLPLHKMPVFRLIDYHTENSKDDLFYLMAGIVFVLAFIRFAFSKYFRNLFLLFFQTTLRQKQTRDQLLQDNLASLLSNLLFIISAGLYITLLIRYKNWTDISFWWLAGGSACILLIVYLIKYLFLLLTGWLFNTKEAAGSYIFIVFMVNKVLGILLVPFLLILSFASPDVVAVSYTISLGVVLLLFAYRYWVSFVAIRSKLNVNPLHFLLYLCAVELLPLVLIYKVLINYFTGSL